MWKYFFRFCYGINARYHIISDYSFTVMFKEEGKKHCMTLKNAMQLDSVNVNLWFATYKIIDLE